MLIVIEGVDGSGKTTLVNEMSHYAPTNTIVLHRGPIKDTPYQEYIKPIIEYDPQTDNIICDRWHLGEMVYGPLFRGESKVDPETCLKIELLLLARGAHMIMLDTAYDEIMRRIGVRGDDMVRPNQIRMIHDFYTEYRTEHSWWEVAQPGIDSARLQIHRARRKGENARKNSFRGMISALRLVVCERIPEVFTDPEVAFIRYDDQFLTHTIRRMKNLRTIDYQNDFVQNELTRRAMR